MKIACPCAGAGGGQMGVIRQKQTKPTQAFSQTSETGSIGTFSSPIVGVRLLPAQEGFPNGGSWERGAGN